MLFKKKIDFTKTSEMIDENKYWSIIEKSLNETSSQDEQEKHIIKQLEKIPLKEIVGFRLRTDMLLHNSYNSKLWCAAYIINGGCSDDSFEYFRNWLISRGKQTFYRVLENPDELAEITDEEDIDFESFWYVALEAFENLTGGNLYDYIDEDNFKTKEGNYPQIVFEWSDEDEESMKKICPKLFDKCL